MALRISSLSLEYVKVPVRATEAGSDVDLSATVVSMAVVGESAAPVTGDWKAAAWEGVWPNLSARLLVGPGGAVSPTPGSYSVWVKVARSPEQPVKHAGKLVVV